jgi:hypothetical protein
MRYYSIKIDGAPSAFPARYDMGAQWGTLINGQHDPNAQQIEFQIMTVDSTTPIENSVVTVYGVSWEQIKACNQLAGKPITIEGGMSPGLPLATFQSYRPKKIISGVILKAWGNWIGTDTSIGMVILPAGMTDPATGTTAPGQRDVVSTATTSDSSSSGSSTGAQRYNRTGPRSLDTRSLPVASAATGFGLSQVFSILGGKLLSELDIGAATYEVGGIVASFFGGGNVSPLAAPINLIHNALPNIPLSSAITETLSRAYPRANVRVLVSAALKLAYQDAGIYQTMEQYAGYLNKLSQSILGTSGYLGVHISFDGNNINVWDGTLPVSNGDISYLELIGQPTWIGPVSINVKVVLRGGVPVGSEIILPDTLTGFGGPDAMLPMGAGGSDPRTNVTLPGAYLVTKVLHVGDFRNPDGGSWSTNYEAISRNATTAAKAASDAVTKSNTDTSVTRGPDLPDPTKKQAQSTLMARSVRRYG